MCFRNVDDGRFMKRYDTLHSVFLEFCGFIGWWDENHGSAMKCDQGADVHLILKRGQRYDEGDIRRKEDACEL